jgi:peptidoglycan/xylan/chitin deacetylase (PgdA/CDA1 family)
MLRYPGFKDKAVTLSYDDASVWDEKLVEIMQENGLKGTFNVNSSWLGGKGHLSIGKAKELYLSAGCEIALHGVSHQTLTELPIAMATREVLLDRIFLEQEIRKPVTGMAYPNGKYNDEVVQILKNCGVEYARTTISTEKFDLPNDWLRLPTTCHHKNPKLMELVSEFLDTPQPAWSWSKKPRLFFLWGHSHEFAADNNWDIIEKFAKKIGNRSDVWYVTNGEVYTYVEAFKKLKFAADGSFIYNPTNIDVYLEYNEKQYYVYAGKLIELSEKEK